MKQNLNIFFYQLYIIVRWLSHEVMIYTDH